MAVPKSRTSKSKSRMRRGAKRWQKPQLNPCPECGTQIPSHIACSSCGFYRNRKILDINSL